MPTMELKNLVPYPTQRDRFKAFDERTSRRLDVI